MPCISTDRVLKSPGCHAQQVAEWRQLAAVAALVRFAEDPQWLAVEWADGTPAATYVTPARWGRAVELQWDELDLVSAGVWCHCSWVALCLPAWPAALAPIPPSFLSAASRCFTASELNCTLTSHTAPFKQGCALGCPAGRRTDRCGSAHSCAVPAHRRGGAHRHSARPGAGGAGNCRRWVLAWGLI